VYGGQRAAKTTFQRLVKQLVDPDKPENLLSINHDKMEFIQQLSHRHVAFYDNLRYKIAWLPEEICKAVTGGGTTKRQLFTNEGDIIFDFKRCIGINGINMIMNEPDVLRRSIIIELESLIDDNMISEEQIFSSAEQLKPDLLGYIFDTISKAMPIKDTIKLKSIPGLADFALWGEAIARSMGYEEMQFVDAYRRNIEKQNEHIIDTNPFAKAITMLYDELEETNDSSVKLKFRFNNGAWSISANGFIEELKGIGFREGIDTADKRFPQSANKLAYQLNIIKPNLRSSGIDIIIRKSRTKEDIDNGFHKNTSIIHVRPIRMLKGKDSNDSNDTLGNFEIKDNNVKTYEDELEVGGSTLTILTIATKEEQEMH
jgi:hypothetical protein